MGTTLQNGVYLPNEGERNCYAGLKTNWEILDQKVADVTALQQAVAGALHREIVESLPTTDIDPNTIYMVLSGTSATENVYNEYMYVNNAWELIGTSATDLTNYYTKAEVDGKLLLKANASDLTSHTGDTTIHVTTADKNKWNNQTYVFRYSSTALVASSTNSNTLLDNTDNLKVGDKVIDSNGVLFSITAIDTQNSTFTIGTALVDLAQDSDVVHKSGNETISGNKTFSDNLTIYNSDDTQTPKGLTIRNAQWVMGESGGTTTLNIQFLDKNSNVPASIIASKGSSGQSFLRFSLRTKDSQNNTYSEEIYYNIDTSGNVSFRPWHDNNISLGTSVYKWKGVYATNYYYGVNNVEFSTKFVTSDTNQTITGKKTFEGISVNFKSISGIYGASSGNASINFLDKNSMITSYLRQGLFNSGLPYIKFNLYGKDANDQTIERSLTYSWLNNTSEAHFRPETDNFVYLGISNNRWKDVQTYKVNGLEPSSLSMPSGNASDVIDISSYFSNTGSGDTNSYTASANGWIFLRLGDISGCQAGIYDANNNRMWGQSATGSVEQLTIPILKGQTLSTQWNTNSTVNVAIARFIPCQGNV